jgi:hypothetical protein
MNGYPVTARRLVRLVFRDNCDEVCAGRGLLVGDRLARRAVAAQAETHHQAPQPWGVELYTRVATALVRAAEIETRRIYMSLNEREILSVIGSLCRDISRGLLHQLGDTALLDRTYFGCETTILPRPSLVRKAAGQHVYKDMVEFYVGVNAVAGRSIYVTLREMSELDSDDRKNLHRYRSLVARRMRR